MDDQHSKDHQLGRFNGPNRFGEDFIHPAPFDDEKVGKNWSDDPRSSASSEPNYFGKGPRGYQRKDHRIREDICDMLTQHPSIDPSEIEVSVSEGIATLEGTVNHRSDRHFIVDLIEEVPGVKAVHNHITVRKHVSGWIPQIEEEDNDRDQNLSDFVKGLY